MIEVPAMPLTHGGHPVRVAIEPDSIWDEAGQLEGHSVIIEGRTIVDVVPSGALPSDLPALRFEGATLLPGLIDCHAHVSDWMLPGFLAAGVTTVRDTGNDLGFILDLKKRCEELDSIGPTLLVCGPLLDGPEVHWERIGRGHRVEADIRATIEDLAERGVDAVKLYVNIDELLMSAAVEAASDAGLPVLAHLGLVDALTAVRLGIREIQHLSGCVHHATGHELSGVDPTLPQRWQEAFVRDGVVNCPTIAVWDRIARINEQAFRSDERAEWVHPAIRMAWEGFSFRTDPVATRLARQASVVTMKETIERLDLSGCVFIAGSDTPFPHLTPGFSLHDELALLVDAGLSTHRALVAATGGAARALGIGDRVGRIASGLDADMVLVGGDPIADISQIGQVEAVLRRGAFVEEDVLVNARNRAFTMYPHDPASLFITDLDTRSNVPNRSSD
jgi:imidazolonepropionase-like amidohydrolase